MRCAKCAAPQDTKGAPEARHRPEEGRLRGRESHPLLVCHRREVQYDDTIVGAGSSGAVQASRLSEDPNRTILLLEASPDYSTVEQTPADLLNTWNLSGRTTGDSWPRQLLHGRSRILAAR